MENLNLTFILTLLLLIISLLPTPFSDGNGIKVRHEKDEPYVGVNISTDLSNLLAPTDLFSFFQLQKITHVRLYDADAKILKALAKTKIRVIVSVPNNQLLPIGSSNVTVAAWIDRNVAAYYPETLITAVAVVMRR